MLFKLWDSARHTSAFASLPEGIGLAFIPLYSPPCRTLSGCCGKSQDLKLDVAHIDFLKEEHTKFERRFEDMTLCMIDINYG